MMTGHFSRRRGAATAFVLLTLPFSNAIDARPERLQALERQVEAARSAAELGEPQLAEHHGRLALVRGLTWLGELALERDDTEAAEQAFARAAAAAPAHAFAARTALATTRIGHGELDEALRELRTVVSSEPESTEARWHLVRALALAGSPSEAAAQLAELRRRAPAEAERLASLLEAAAAEPARAGAILDVRRIAPEQARAGEQEHAVRAAELVAEAEALLSATSATSASSASSASSATVSGQLPAPEIEGPEQTEHTEAELLATIEADPRRQEARQQLARRFLADGRTEDATELMRQAAAFGPLDRDLAFRLAEIERHEGRLAASDRQLRSLAERFASAAAETGLAANAAAAGEPKRAFDHARRALELAPASEAALRLHASLGLEAGLPSAVMGSVEILARMKPEDGYYAYLVGRVWQAMGDSGEASEALLRAVERDPDHLPSQRALGLALAREQRYAEARGHLERYLDTYPDDLDVLAALAEVEERLGDAEAAEARTRRVLEREPRHATANLVLGMVLSRRAQFTEARQALEIAVATDSRLAKAHYQLSFACARLGDRDCARRHLAHYRRALEGDEAEMGVLQKGGNTTLMLERAPVPEPPPSKRDGGGR